MRQLIERTEAEDKRASVQFETALERIRAAKNFRFEISPLATFNGSAPVYFLKGNPFNSLTGVLKELGLLDGQTLWCGATLEAGGDGHLIYGFSVDVAYGPRTKTGVTGLTLTYNDDGHPGFELKKDNQGNESHMMEVYDWYSEILESDSEHPISASIFKMLFVDAAELCYDKRFGIFR